MNQNSSKYMKITCVCNQQAYDTSFVCETPEGTGQAEDYRLKLSLGKRATTKLQDTPEVCYLLWCMNQNSTK